MFQRYSIHPDNPQGRAIAQAAAALDDGRIVVYPTDSCYALGWAVDANRAADAVRELRGLSDKQPFAMMCPDLAGVARFAKLDNAHHRLVRQLTPGPYTFLLPATRELPRRLTDAKRRVVGVRIPDSRVAMALIEAHGQPFMTSTLQLSGEALPISELDELPKRLTDRVGVFLDGGAGGFEPSTVLDLTGAAPEIVRVGRGPVDDLIAG